MSSLDCKVKFAKERNRLSVLVCHQSSGCHHFIMKQRTNTEQHVIHNIAAYAHKHSAETETLCVSPLEPLQWLFAVADRQVYGTAH